MKRKKQLTTIMFVTLTAVISYWFAQTGTNGFAQDPGQEKSRSKDKIDPAIAETKKKGFDGVDFSYDVFGTPPGQDPQETARKVMEKDIAEKPKVMARQKNLLQDRYSLDCKDGFRHHDDQGKAATDRSDGEAQGRLELGDPWPDGAR